MRVVLVGESGSGKDTLLEWFKQNKWHVIISHTTRSKRDGESDSAYMFSDHETFTKHKNLDMVFEYVTFGGNIYWTLVSDYLIPNWVIITETEGARTLKREFPDVFIIYLKTDRVTRIARVGEERVLRDDGNFMSFPCDYVIDNNSTIENLKMRLIAALEWGC